MRSFEVGKAQPPPLPANPARTVSRCRGDHPDSRRVSWATGPSRPVNVRNLWISVAAGVALSCVVSHGLITACRFGPVDDAFITAKYARNWAAGRGLCFNPGEKVEGFSSFLLVAIEAFCARVGVDPSVSMRAVSRGSLLVLAGLLGVLFWRLVVPGSAPIAGIAAGLCASNPALVAWSASGMETVGFSALLLAGIAVAALARRTVHQAASAVLMVLAALLRPEGVAYFPLALGAVWCTNRDWRALRPYAGILAVGCGAFLVWRCAYFGEVLPMPFFAKLDFGSVALVRRGLVYVGAFAAACPLLLLGGLGSLAFLRRSPCWVRACLGAVATNIVVTIYEGGDHFPFFRFLLPSIPFLGLLAFYWLSSLDGVHSSRHLRIALVATGALTVVGTSLITARATVRVGSRRISHMERFALESWRARRWARLGEWFKANAPSDASLATVAIGAVGYHSNLRIVDPLGLISPSIAHKHFPLGTALAGHEKYDVGEVLAQRPSYIMAVHVPTPLPVDRDELENVAWGEFNKNLARDGRVDQAYRYEVLPWERTYVNLFVRADLPTPGRHAEKPVPHDSSPSGRPDQLPNRLGEPAE